MDGLTNVSSILFLQLTILKTLITSLSLLDTYVMKLFDRSVDLAQFDEDTPLYPICRAWMINQPHNRNLGPSEPEPVSEPSSPYAFADVRKEIISLGLLH